MMCKRNFDTTCIGDSEDERLFSPRGICVNCTRARVKKCRQKYYLTIRHKLCTGLPVGRPRNIIPC